MLEAIREDPSMGDDIMDSADYLRVELHLAAGTEMVTRLDDFLRRRSKIALVVRDDDVRDSDGLCEVAEILFGDGPTRSWSSTSARSRGRRRLTAVRMRGPGADDTPALYHVSLKTGDVDGGDASSLYDDPELLGHLWLGAYLALEPELARVVEDDSGHPGGLRRGRARHRSIRAAVRSRMVAAVCGSATAIRARRRAVVARPAGHGRHPPSRAHRGVAGP